MNPSKYAKMLRRDLGAGVSALFEKEGLTEWGVNPHSENVWVESHAEGRRQTDLTLSDAHARRFLNRVADAEGITLTAETPVLEAALPDQPPFDGARLTGVVPPMTSAPTLAARILPREAFLLEAFTDGYEPEDGKPRLDPLFGKDRYEALVRAIEDYDNVFVVGGTGSGKTTLAMSLLREISERFPDEHLLTMEDTRELVVGSWCRTALFKSDVYGHSYRDLINVSLRLSPSRLVMGECRGPAILDLFDTVLSGHPGAVCTFHAQSARKALRRMMIYCRRASDTSAHHYTIADAVDLMVVIQKRGGERRVTEMVRVTGYSETGGYDLEPA